MNKQKYYPLVSIITPTYNHEKYIEQCIRSVLEQSYTNWEQIIIDDGSTDLTPHIVAKYTCDERIRYIRQRHMGIWKLGETYNKALSLAQGELIAILEGDDFWPPDKLEQQVLAFENPEVVLTWGIGIYVDEKGQSIGKSKKIRFTDTVYQDKRKIIKKLLFRNFISPTVTVMVRKNTLLSVGGFKQPPNAICVDYATWFDLVSQGKFVFIDSVLGYWRRHASQITVKYLWAMEKGELATYRSLRDKRLISWFMFMEASVFSMGKYIRRLVVSRLIRARLAKCKNQGRRDNGN